MDQLSWFKLYPRDFLMDRNVERLSIDAFGLYTYLLMRSWIDGSIPAELDEIAKYPHLRGLKKSRLERMWNEIESCWPMTEQGRTRANPRLEQERGRAEARQTQSSKGGIIGAQVRWQNAEKKQNCIESTQKSALSESSPYKNQIQIQNQIQSIEQENPIVPSGTSAAKPPKRKRSPSELTPEQLVWFEEWYKLYPRHESRGDAEKAYRKHAPDKTGADRMLSGLKIGLTKLLATEPKYIPLPASWINARKWEDLPSR